MADDRGTETTFHPLRRPGETLHFLQAALPAQDSCGLPGENPAPHSEYLPFLAVDFTLRGP